MLLVVCCWLLICQTTFVRPDGIKLPITSIVYKSSPAESKPLSISFTPNVCNESPACKTSPGSRSIESVNIPRKLQESCIEQESQAQSVNYANKPFKTVSISTALDPSIDNPLEIKSFNPTAAFIPQAFTSPQINLPYFENSNFVNTNVGFNDYSHRQVPPVVQYTPSYIITSTDNGKIKVPLKPVTFDDLPSNIQKVKIDSKPIFIDCSKPNTYQKPTSLSSSNLVATEVPKSTNWDTVQNSRADNRYNQPREDYVISKASPVFIENPIMSSNVNNMMQKYINKATIEEKTTNIDSPASTGKVIYPINDVKFNYIPNNFNQLGPPEKVQTYSAVPPKIAPIDNIVGLDQPAVNVISPQTQNKIQSVDNVNCYWISNNLLQPQLRCESPCFLSEPSSSSILSQTYVPEIIPAPVVPVSQLPIVNTFNKLIGGPMCGPTCASSYETKSDTFSSQLSGSLNSIISLLTAGLLSTVFGNSIPQKLPDFVPTQIPCDINLQEPVIDIETYAINTDTFVSIPSFTSCLSPVEPPVVLQSPEINLPLKEFSPQDYSTPSVVCDQKAPKPKPYLASITINIMPSPDTTNDIIIVI